MIDFDYDLTNDLVVVELLETTGNVLLPDWQNSLKGVVVACGPGQLTYEGTRLPMTVQPGDIVSFGAAAGMDTRYGTQGNIRIMHDTDIDGVWHETDA